MHFLPDSSQMSAALFRGLLARLALLFVLGVHVLPLHSEDRYAMEVELSHLHWVREGLDTDFDELDRRLTELLEKSDDPVWKSRLYVAAVHVHALSGLAQASRAIKYAEAAEKLPLLAVDEAQLHLSWGDAIQFVTPGARGEKLVEVRRNAAEHYLKSVRVAVKNKVPVVLPDKPDDELLITTAPRKPSVKGLPEKFARRLIEQYESNKQAREQAFENLRRWNELYELHARAEISRDLAIKLYKMSPHNNHELKAMAAEILGKSKWNDSLLTRLHHSDQ